jgi:hypothetical protein
MKLEGFLMAVTRASGTDLDTYVPYLTTQNLISSDPMGAK